MPKKICRVGIYIYLCNPETPIGITKCGNSSVGRAQPCQGWGRGSESRFPLNILKQQEFCFEYGVFENGEVAELVDALL